MQEKIVNTGALPLYCKLLEQDHTSKQWETEQINAAKGLWTLAFNDKIRKQILGMPSLMTGNMSITITQYQNISFTLKIDV